MHALIGGRTQFKCHMTKLFYLLTKLLLQHRAKLVMISHLNYENCWSVFVFYSAEEGWYLLESLMVCFNLSAI